MILVLESSTTSAKAMLYDGKLGVIKVENNPFLARVHDGVDEIGTQDAQAVLDQTLLIGKKVAQGEKIDAIVLSTTWHNLLVCNANMVPITPAYCWNYTGATQEAAKLRHSLFFASDFYQRTGCIVHTTYPAFKILALKKRGIKLDRCYLTNQGSYMFYCLTGQYCESESMASGSGLLNIHTRLWDADILKQLGVVPEQLGRLVSYKDTAPLRDKAAQLLGVQAGIPVLPAYPDGALNQVGAGALQSHVLTFSVGTSGALRLSTSQPVLPPTPSTWCYLSPTGWLSGAATSGACNCVDWIKRTVFTPNVSFSEIEKMPISYSTMPIFLPFLFGERSPGWHEKGGGGFWDVLPAHTNAELYYSVLEGVLFNLYQCYRILCRVSQEPNTIQLSGGILHSARWKQMCCNLFGRSMHVDSGMHSSMIGGAVLGLEVTGQIPSVMQHRAEIAETLQPDPVMHALFQKRFEKYLEIYNQIRK